MEKTRQRFLRVSPGVGLRSDSPGRPARSGSASNSSGDHVVPPSRLRATVRHAAALGPAAVAAPVVPHVDQELSVGELDDLAFVRVPVDGPAEDHVFPWSLLKNT